MSLLKKLLAVTAGASLITLGATATVQAVTLTSTADSYISNNLRTANFGNDPELRVKNDSEGNQDRKAYIRFDLSSITSPLLTSATFSLTGRSSIGTINPGVTSRFDVYGLTTGNQNWVETGTGGINWLNAPANDGSDAGVATGNSLVASFNVTGTGVGTTNVISDSRLLTFLNARINAPDNNNLATFIVTRFTPSSTVGIYAHAFNSRTTFAGNQPSEPTLDVTAQATAVPFEFSPGLGILVLGAWGAMAQIKSKVKNRKPLKVTFFSGNDGQPESV